MNKYIFLLLIVAFGFSAVDVRKEVYVLDWSTLIVNENGISVIAELNFENAAFPDPESLIPVFYKTFELAQDQNYQFILENEIFEEVKLLDDIPGYYKIENQIKVETQINRTDENKLLHLQITTFKREGNKILRLKSFVLKKFPVTESAKLKSIRQAESKMEWKSNSVLKQGKWIKISVAEKGIVKIPYSKLTSWGFPDPANVNVFGSGGAILSEDPGVINYDDLEQCTVWREKNNGTDCLFFYARGTTEWNYDENEESFIHALNDYASKGYYFLTNNVGSQKNVELLPVVQEAATHSVTSFDEYRVYENELENVLKLGSGKQWFGEKFGHSSVKNIDFDLKDIVTTEKLKVRIGAIARSFNTSEMKVLANQVEIGALKFYRVNTGNQTANYADEQKAALTATVQGNTTRITLKYFADNINNSFDENAVAWLDNIELNYRRKLKFSNEPLYFRDYLSVGENNIIAFTFDNSIAGSRIFDITNTNNVKEVPLEISGNTAIAKRPGSMLSEYVAFSPNGSFQEPELVGEVPTQNLHAISTPDFIIISHPNFLSSANRLAEFHRNNDGMTVEVVSADQVYNEFSSGARNSTGIRNFIKMMYDRGENLKYVLLFGDGSFDNRGIRPETKNFIPTYQSENSLLPVASFVTDDYFVILEAGESVYNGTLDLGIGRIPAATAYEAELVMNKIENYHASKSLGNWRNIVCFIGDDEDGSLHMSDSEKLAIQLNNKHKEFITEKIYLDAYLQQVTAGEEKYPDVNDAINKQVKEGVLILNYVGHANERYMADEHVLEISNVNSWSNSDNLPIFVTATCEFSRFDADDKSIGEYVLLNPTGGGVGLFSTSRLVFAYSNFLLSQSFYNYVFESDKQGNRYRMGDIIRLAKNNTINTINKRNFTLLADPALRIQFPKNKVVTTTINGKSAENFTDTLNALQKVSIQGSIEDYTGNSLTNFTGEVAITIYDKETTATTLGNNGEVPFSFKVRENIIYKGKANVTNGSFSFDFVIPKDISYVVGQGKIMYYAENGTTDASGAFTNFLVGGVSTQSVTDTQGPKIELFIDNNDFVSGGSTSKNPLLLAYLSDENGINTAGTGIGHDITAVLDNDYPNVVVLNKYYQADINSYKSGVVNFPFANLSVGKHKLTLKAWDVANNSSEVEIEFEVTGEFFISQVFNSPNPANYYTSFYFDHNQSDATFNVMIEIFDQSGRRVELLVTESGSGGTRSNPVRWDFNETTTLLRNGLYIYRITAQNNEGIYTTKSGKLLISR